MDIVVDYEGEKTGFLADDIQSYFTSHKHYHERFSVGEKWDCSERSQICAKNFLRRL